jgi:hypothetical protein
VIIQQTLPQQMQTVTVVETIPQILTFNQGQIATPHIEGLLPPLQTTPPVTTDLPAAHFSNIAPENLLQTSVSGGQVVETNIIERMRMMPQIQTTNTTQIGRILPVIHTQPPITVLPLPQTQILAPLENLQ